MSHRGSSSALTTAVHLSQRDLDTLVRVSDLYMSARPFRLLVRVTAPRSIRLRLRYVAEECKWLKRFSREARVDMRVERQDSRDVSLTLPALVGFLGRLLASVNTPRHRRRLSQSEYDVRQSLIERFQNALAGLLNGHRREVEAQIQTRRPVEEIWIRERIGLPLRDNSAPRQDTFPV